MLPHNCDLENRIVYGLSERYQTIKIFDRISSRIIVVEYLFIDNLGKESQKFALRVTTLNQGLRLDF